MPSSNTISPSSFTSSFLASHCTGDFPSISCSPSSPQYRFIASAAVALPCPALPVEVERRAHHHRVEVPLRRRPDKATWYQDGDAGYIEYPSHQY
ncbi:hypothetical protein [Streptomyces sp. NPDC006012]|uniref:hypothetical protein n=1 Tax=Streptomyces sp. NPDC006012 TaxID=3364739 RepID=UPI0036C9407B